MPASDAGSSIQSTEARLPSTAPTQVEAPEKRVHPLLGKWRCTFDDYPAMTCVVRAHEGGFWLEKTQGSQRIKGVLTPRADTLHFEGTFYCPYGACTSSARTVFRKQGKRWVGTLEHDQDGYPMRTRVVLSR